MLYSWTLLKPKESKYYNPLSITMYDVKSLVPVQKNYLSGPSPLKLPVIAGLTTYHSIFFYIEIFIRNIQKCGIFRSIGPFMEIRKVSINLKLAQINLNLTHSMSSINKKRNSFFLKELTQTINRHNNPRHWYNMIKNS